MTNFKQKPSKSMSQTINGACFMLAIIGLALITNRLLDRAGFANEAALSQDERKEKAHRNQAEYDQAEIKATKIGWFSSSKYDCENPQVQERVQEIIACETLLSCKTLGLTFTQAKAMTKQQVIDKLDALYEPEVAAAAKRVTTNLNLPLIRKGLKQMLDGERDVLLTYPSLFQNVRALTDDYNESVSRYSCRMSFKYNQNVYVPFWKVVLRTQYSKDPTTSAVADDMARKNPDLDYIGNLVNVQMKLLGIAAKSQSPEPKAADFTVQPSGDSFVVEVKNIDKLMPGL